jgi:hypothetical protein
VESPGQLPAQAVDEELQIGVDVIGANVDVDDPQRSHLLQYRL